MVYSYLEIQKPTKSQQQETILKYRALFTNKFIKIKQIHRITPLLSPQLMKHPTIVLDLDKTILYSTSLPQNTSCINIQYSDGLYTSYRNFLPEFLIFLDKYFEIIIWSAGENQYVRNRVTYIQQFIKQPLQALSRAACTHLKGAYIKDLRVLGRDLKNTILIDDNYISCAFQYDNCLPVNEFEGQSDNELIDLEVFLKKLLSYSCLVYGLERQLNQFQ
ncbi:Nuclear LIM interactor-interacting factor [Spironucleus salmonicida]|nr:Nuclear LIM interactor-interacting factor [Spironucleus salmonicida]